MGNRVVAEEELSGGRPFRTRLAGVPALREGRVFRVRQYVDSAYLQPSAPDLAAHVFEAAGSRSVSRPVVMGVLVLVEHQGSAHPPPHLRHGR